MRSSFSGRQSPRYNPFNDRNSSITDDQYDTTSQSEITSTGSDDGSDEVSFAELGLTEDYFSHPEGHFGLSTIEELEAAIENCKSMIQSAKANSERQKKLVKTLVELRMKFQELKEGPEELEPKLKQVLGHKLRKRKSKSIKNYCDCCNGLIWGVLQIWYRCRECDLNCHSKCINSIRRKCIPNNTDNLTYILNISPEMGLSWQQFSCIECKNQISIEGVGREEARLCDYTGRYFCPHCHWNDEFVTPARVIRGWDFSPQKVARQSYQILKRLYRRPLLNLEELNPLLFNYVDELRDICKLRQDILLMKLYFLACNNAMEQKQLLKLRRRQHFVDNSTMFSMEDLVLLKQGELLDEIATVVSEFAQHIKFDCIQCQVKGFYCEICNTGETLYAFDPGVSVCTNCKAVFHKDCFMFGDCPRCERMEQRKRRKNTIDFDDDEFQDPLIAASSDSAKITDDSTKIAETSNNTSSTIETTRDLTDSKTEQDNISGILVTDDTTTSLKNISLHPYLSESGMLRSRLSLPAIKQGKVYSVSSPEKPDYKHDWDVAIEEDFKKSKVTQGAGKFEDAPVQKKPAKQNFSKDDILSGKFEHNPITRRPQRDESEFSDLVKVRGRSRNKSGKKERKPVDIDDPFGKLHETKGSKFMKEVSSVTTEVNSSINPFEKPTRRNQYNPTLDRVNTERQHGKKFIDGLSEAATSKTGLSKYDSYDPDAVPFFQNDPPSKNSSNLSNPRLLGDNFQPKIENSNPFHKIDRGVDVVKPSSRSHKSRQPSYDPSLDPFQSNEPSAVDYDNEKNPFE